jgi:hypothetical protein
MTIVQLIAFLSAALGYVVTLLPAGGTAANVLAVVLKILGFFVAAQPAAAHAMAAGPAVNHPDLDAIVKTLPDPKNKAAVEAWGKALPAPTKP